MLRNKNLRHGVSPYFPLRWKVNSVSAMCFSCKCGKTLMRHQNGFPLSRGKQKMEQILSRIIIIIIYEWPSFPRGLFGLSLLLGGRCHRRARIDTNILVRYLCTSWTKVNDATRKCSATK